MEVNDLLGIAKLAEVIKDAIGGVANSTGYFDAKKIKRIGEAEAEVEKIKTLNRAEIRFELEQYNKQVNLENIFVKTKDLLEGEEVSNDPVEKDWANRFMGIAQDVSREYLQDLLAKILAGEIKQPNSFSYRTLETLKNLTKQELELFKKLAILSDHLGGIFLLDQKVNSIMDINYTDICTLMELGLLQSDFNGGFDLKESDISKINLDYLNKNRIAIISDNKSQLRKLQLSTVGKDIKKLFKINKQDSDYIYDYLSKLKDFFEENHGLESNITDLNKDKNYSMIENRDYIPPLAVIG